MFELEINKSIKNVKYIRKNEPQFNLEKSSDSVTKITLSSNVPITNLEVITIGTQIWKKKNLDVSTFRNGDSIPEIKSSEEWNTAAKNEKPGWCYYYYNIENGKKYGKLYNCYAVNDLRGLAPNGWHVPTYAELTKLTDYLGGAYRGAGDKMKSKEGWNGSNESGFSALPGGGRSADGTFFDIGSCGCWWSSTQNYPNYTWYLYLNYNDRNVNMNAIYEHYGFSVRCLRD